MIPHSAQTTEGFIPTETNASLINMIKKKKEHLKADSDRRKEKNNVQMLISDPL